MIISQFYFLKPKMNRISFLFYITLHFLITQIRLKYIIEFVLYEYQYVPYNL